MSNILSNIGKFSEDENSTIEAIRDYFRETKMSLSQHRR